MFHLRKIYANRQAEKTIQPAHPLCVATGQVIVDSYNVYALSSQGVQISRQSGNEGFAFASAHFRDFSVMQRDAAQKLHVEMAHV